MLKLVGSTTSPYVRKIILLLEELSYEYEFENIQALSDEGVEALKAYGPLMRIPILIDNGKNIYDSTIIAEYLLEKKNIRLNLDDKLQSKLINELCDCGVDLVKQKAWKIDESWEDKRSRKVLTRLDLILTELNTSLQQLNKRQQDWLYCALDWLLYRSILDFNGKYKKLEKFYQESMTEEKFIKTKPRL